MRQLKPSRVRHTDEPGGQPQKGIAKDPPRVLQRCLLQGRLLAEFVPILGRYDIPRWQAFDRSIVLGAPIIADIAQYVWPLYLVTPAIADGDTLGQAIDATTDAILAGGTLRPLYPEEARIQP